MSINKNVLTVFLVIEKLRLLCSALLDTCVCARLCGWAHRVFFYVMSHKKTLLQKVKKNLLMF